MKAETFCYVAVENKCYNNPKNQQLIERTLLLYILLQTISKKTIYTNISARIFFKFYLIVVRTLNMILTLLNF